MERYLRKCLDSLLVPSRFEDLEVLVVNDGSNDGTLKIAQTYATQYPTVFRVIDKPNGNYGSCINRGLKVATGKYVKVLDADDSFDTNGLDAFLSQLSKTDADLVLSDYVKVSVADDITSSHSFDLPEGKVLKRDEICSEPSFLKMQMHAVTYRLQMLRDMHYHQTEGISYTDQQWIFMPMLQVRTVCYYRTSVYRYLIGREGQTVNADSIKYTTHLIPCMGDIIRFYAANRRDVGASLNVYYSSILIPLTKAIYVELLLNGTEEARIMLRSFDAQLLSWSSEVYELIGSHEVSSFMGLEYIRYWREHPKLPSWIVKMFGLMYVKALQLRKNR